MKFRAARPRQIHPFRSNSGIYLIEMLYAVAISGFLAVILGNSLSQTMQMSGKTEHKLLSYEIAEQILDRVRNTPFAQLTDGTHNIRVNLTSPPSDPYAIENTSIALAATHVDSVNLGWRAGSNNTPAYAFNGGAILTISDIDANTKACSVKVTSPANSTANSFTLGTVVSQYGICTSYQ